MAAETLFLRIGDWHDSETSRNYATGEAELGVSVYELGPEGGIVVPPESEWARQDLMDRLRLGEVRHLVRGRVAGWGGDGEPLLRDLEMVGAWPADVPRGYAPELDPGADVLPVAEAPEVLSADDPYRARFGR